MLTAGDSKDESFPLGALLYARRVFAGIDCHDMGRKIGLSAWQVRALESGDSSAFRGQDSFTRALRLYSRKLDIGPIAESAVPRTPRSISPARDGRGDIALNLSGGSPDKTV